MAACDAHQFCDEDTREWNEQLDVEREEVVDAQRGSGGISATCPRYSYMLSVPEGQVGLTPSNWPPAPVFVKHVVPCSPAAKVYVELGDEVLAINGRPICEMDRASFDLNMQRRPLVLWMHRTKARRMSL